MTTADPYTMEARLCSDDGVVRGGAMHHGTDYPCTGHAHFAGEHIRCISPAHSDVPALPGDLLDALDIKIGGRFTYCAACSAPVLRPTARCASCGHGGPHPVAAGLDEKEGPPKDDA